MPRVIIDDYEAEKRYWREALLFAVFGLVALGFIMTASVDGPWRGIWPALMGRALRVLLGLAFFLVAYFIRLDKARQLVLPAFVTSIFLCLVPRLVGDSSHGAYRWIDIGFTSVQPVELLKVVAVLATAELLERRRASITNFRHGVLPIIAVPTLAILVLLQQPDIGHAFFVTATCGIMILCGGVLLRHSATLMLVAGAALWLVLGGFSHSRTRLSEFGSGEPGYQLGRSLLAFAQGGLTGEGPGAGWIKMGFLPEARNDFVYAVLGNELGVFGSLLVLALFGLLFASAMRITRLAPSRWHFLVALGIGMTLVVQACINILGVTFTIPEKGIDLPFLSSGGTNLVFALGSVGILANIAKASAGATSSGASDARGRRAASSR